MLLYYTQVKVNDNFTTHELINMFIYWMQNTKNRISSLDYDNSLNYIHENNHKRFEIKNFNNQNILGIQFITNQNYKKNLFTVEVLYSYKQKTIDLAFYKEISNDAKYIPKLSIPKIFNDIINNNNILKDHDLKIQEQPHFIHQKHFKSILSKQHYLPLIILYRKERCCINPIILNKDVFGIAHVLVVNDNIKSNTIEIIYPNNEKEILSYHNHFNKIEIFDHIRNYMIQENQFLSFDELKRLELLQTYQKNTISANEFQEYFLEEIESMKNEIQQLQQIYEDKKTLYQKLLKKNNEYYQLNHQYNDEILISIDKENYKDYQKLILSIIDKNLKNLDSSKIYRRKDILESIKRKQKT